MAGRLYERRAIVESGGCGLASAGVHRYTLPVLKRLWRRLKVRLGPDGRRILALHDGLEGLIFVEESAWLYLAARGRRTIVEIGSFRGKSCVMLALGSADTGGRITAIDPHLNIGSDDRTSYSQADDDAFMAAVRRHGVAERVDKKRLTSEQALAEWDGSGIDLLWVDGDHSYEGVHFDLAHWSRFVPVGGVIAAHDYTHLDAVRKAWDDVIVRDGRWTPTDVVRSIAWAQRRE